MLKWQVNYIYWKMNYLIVFFLLLASCCGRMKSLSESDQQSIDRDNHFSNKYKSVPRSDQRVLQRHKTNFKNHINYYLSTSSYQQTIQIGCKMFTNMKQIQMTFEWNTFQVYAISVFIYFLDKNNEQNVVLFSNFWFRMRLSIQQLIQMGYKINSLEFAK